MKKISPFAVAAFLVTSSCGIPDAFAEAPEGAKPELGPFISTINGFVIKQFARLQPR